MRCSRATLSSQFVLRRPLSRPYSALFLAQSHNESGKNAIVSCYFITLFSACLVSGKIARFFELCREFATHTMVSARPTVFLVGAIRAKRGGCEVSRGAYTKYMRHCSIQRSISPWCTGRMKIVSFRYQADLTSTPGGPPIARPM